MKRYLALTGMDVKLALRDRQTLFFTYLFPLIFFFSSRRCCTPNGAAARSRSSSPTCW